MHLNFKLYEGNPLREGEFPARCNMRCIVKHEGLYHIFEEDHIHGHWRIFKRVSEDGIKIGKISNPLFELGDKNEFDEFGQADPTVIFDGKWRMWFDAMDRETHWSKIGYAESEDGERWIKKGIAFEKGTFDQWDDHSVHHPVVLKHDNYYLYYSGCQKIKGNPINYNVKNIGLAISDDGLVWIKQGIVIPCGNKGEWNSEYVRPSVPVLLNGLWFMFYWGFNGVNHGMGFATSKDLIYWTKQGLIVSGNSKANGFTASHAISDGNKAKIWFTTYDNLQLNIADVIYE